MQDVGEQRVAALVEGDALALESPSTTESRCWPMSTRSRAFSKSSIETSFAPRRTACRAASLTRFARSAPLIPGVPRATVGQIDVASQRFATVDLEDGEPLVEVGEGTTIWRSNLPGRSRAESRTSGRLVAPIITTPSYVSKPSISDEHLVEGLLALVVAAAQSRAALAADRVDLVDEDDRRGCLRACLEKVPHTAGTDADEHLHEIRAAH